MSRRLSWSPGQLFDDWPTRHILDSNRISLYITQHSELHKSASLYVALIMQDRPALLPPRTAYCSFSAPPDLVWTQPKDHTYTVRSFHIIFNCRGARCILNAPASSVRQPARPVYRNSLYYGSLSKFDANSLGWRERLAMAWHHMPDYSHANLTVRLL